MGLETNGYSDAKALRSGSRRCMGKCERCQTMGGELNAAPFSFFNAFSGDPPIVGIGIASRDSGRPKETRANIEATRQFVVNLASEENAKAMNVTAIDFDHEVNKLDIARMTTLPSTHVTPPRIAESPVALECELVECIDLGLNSGLILGRVLATPPYWT